LIRTCVASGSGTSRSTTSNGALARDLERDGLVSRRVHAVVPPRVDYKLTKLGEGRGEAVCGIWTWIETHMKDVERSRRAYDLKLSKQLTEGCHGRRVPRTRALVAILAVHAKSS
jgi:hypothetical protein